MTPRLEVFVAEYRAQRARQGRPLTVLDVGCGVHAELAEAVADDDRYVGVDFPERIEARVEYVRADLNRDSLAELLGEQRFDVIFCGEVVEHLFSPDDLLDDLHRLLAPEGIVVLSTPNLAYWANRLLLLAGFSPLFLENSSRAKLGRRLRLLGQGSETQGHVRLFTYDALRELAQRSGFRVVRATAVQVWNSPIDRLICRVSHRLAPDNVLVLAHADEGAAATEQRGRLDALSDAIRRRAAQDWRRDG
jgi:hypothetical protein